MCHCVSFFTTRNVNKISFTLPVDHKIISYFQKVYKAQFNFLPSGEYQCKPELAGKIPASRHTYKNMQRSPIKILLRPYIWNCKNVLIFHPLMDIRLKISVNFNSFPTT